jgi:hypothetical protein
MATATLGTAATTTLTAVPFTYGLVAADFATMAAAIKRDSHNPGNSGSTTGPGLTGPQPPLGVPLSRAGTLIIPERGILKLFPGDYIAIDATGWPILLSPRAAASASWVHT